MPDVNPKQLVAVLVTVIALMVAALVGFAIIDGVTTASTQSGTDARAASPLVTVGESATFQDTSYFAGEITSVASVNDSSGHAISLDGSPDSEYQSDDPITIASDQTWTTSVYADWSSQYGTSNGTVYSLNGRVILQYDNTTSQWIGYYYDESTRYSHRVTIQATQQPGNLQNIQLVANGTHVTIYRNNTRGEVEDLRVENHEEPLLNASNWAGRQDELRGYDTALSASERQALIDSPVQPLNNADRQYRVMFDEGGGNSEPVYFTDATLSLSDVSWVSGLPGNTLSEGVDYELSKADGTVTALDGGKLDTAPTVFISYTLQSNAAAEKLTGDIAGAMELIAVVPIILIAGLLVGVVMRFQA